MLRSSGILHLAWSSETLPFAVRLLCGRHFAAGCRGKEGLGGFCLWLVRSPDGGDNILEQAYQRGGRGCLVLACV